ncbi:MAG: tetratricopeptide repeat protein [Chitinophagales bacterium]
MQKLGCVFLFIVIPLLQSTAQTFEYNSQCQQAYEAIFSLRLEQAKKLLQQEKQAHPNNLIPILLENYIDFFTVFITEEETELDTRIGKKDERLELLKAGDENSPYYLFSQAEVNLQWAFARIKFAQYFKAVWEIRRAYKLLEANEKKFPNFAPNKKSLGILHAMVGTVPDNYQWGMKILGMEGTIAQGMGEIQSYLQYASKNDRLFYDETKLLYSFFLIYIDTKTEQAWQIAQTLPTKNHLLNTLVAAQLSFRTGHNDYAIQLLTNRPKGEEYMDFYLLDFLLGTMKLNRLDADADVYLKRFVQNFNGKHFIKEAYQKLAWHALVINNNQDAYQKNMERCKSKGSKWADPDKQAYKEAVEGSMPNRTLLKGRLLFDGGYFQKALTVLQSANYKTPAEILECHYRFGRIYEGLGDNKQAIEYYKKTIEENESVGEGHFFAPKASLQLAKLYERQNEKETAMLYFKKCLRFKNHEYKDSIDQQAKAGMNRLKG